ncbi:hypothetical protein PF001_g18308 [Phytophthora fragariae]|uniref:Uncharacterized protein n=1 Tax=Phytophthora fragariae TaxID=53985 RepID=A0A6A4CM12_9STRA|nr:hypothetical protein PF001_g18308 [Phytophthora fragariae]
MNLYALLLAAVASLVAVHAEVTYIDHDQVQPFPEPKPTTDSEKCAVKYKPQFLVSYGCHPYPAVQADGAVSAGLKRFGPPDGECTKPTLGSQVYSRSDWYKDKWAIMYAWYLPKGKFNSSEQAGETQALITWEQLTDEARDALSNANFDGRVIKNTLLEGGGRFYTKSKAPKSELQRLRFSPRILDSTTPFSVAAEWFRLFRFGLKAYAPQSELWNPPGSAGPSESIVQRDFVSATMAEDVVVHVGRGVEAVLEG